MKNTSPRFAAGFSALVLGALAVLAIDLSIRAGQETQSSTMKDPVKDAELRQRLTR